MLKASWTQLESGRKGRQNATDPQVTLSPKSKRLTVNRPALAFAGFNVGDKVDVFVDAKKKLVGIAPGSTFKLVQAGKSGAASVSALTLLTALDLGPDAPVIRASATCEDGKLVASLK